MIEVYPKINIGLNVLFRRADGFHEIETVFHKVRGSWKDFLEIEPADEFSIMIEGEGVDWDPRQDLCAKAWALMGVPPVRIRLIKNIPVGAGLGGGSADCAETIRELDRIFSLGLTRSGMQEIAASLGSDCAFFLGPDTALALGRGEELYGIDLNLSRYEIRLEIPEGERVSTREAYGKLAPRPLERVPRKGLEKILTLKDPSLWRGEVVNDFEQSVFPAHEGIAKLKERFYAEGALYASMTGSGAAVYGIFEK